ncbi:MAG: hypothetical protein OXI67_09880 [Candidatus Poribacteria bacterium]|nr:hypothetical protein [Candidatus Poribacteria bacterium]
MNRKFHWGIAALIVILIAAGGFMYWQWSSVQQLKEEVAENDKLIGHFHADGSFHEGPHEEDPSRDDLPKQETREVPETKPSVKVSKEKRDAPKAQPKKLYTGPLTFHVELLKTNPVKALRLQTEERGNWAAEWIPPFPTDDIEAQEFAKAIYLFEYYHHTFGDLFGTPEYEKETRIYAKASGDMSRMEETIMSYPYGARKYDLLKLTWPHVDKYVVSDSKGNVNSHPSEYFGNPETRRQLKALGMWDY